MKLVVTRSPARPTSLRRSARTWRGGRRSSSAGKPRAGRPATGPPTAAGDRATVGDSSLNRSEAVTFGGGEHLSTPEHLTVHEGGRRSEGFGTLLEARLAPAR